MAKPVSTRMTRRLPLWLLPGSVAAVMFCRAQGTVEKSVMIVRPEGGAVELSVPAAAGNLVKFEVTQDLVTWEPLHTGVSDGAVAYLDGGAAYRAERFYRAVAVSGPEAVTGDHVQTSDGVVTIKPIHHGSFYLHWAGAAGTRIIYSDPSSQGAPAGRFSGLPPADLVLVTHRHGDHLNVTTLDSLRNGSVTRIVAPQDVVDAMGNTSPAVTLKGLTTVFRTGQASAAANSPPLEIAGITVEGVPAYNANHVKGNCNSYILTIGGKRFFISGDTGSTPEMNAMTGIDVAFLCMNTPFTLTVTGAATAVRAFRPGIVYPYHYRNQDGSLSDLELFRSLVGRDLGIEVRNRNWY